VSRRLPIALASFLLSCGGGSEEESAPIVTPDASCAGLFGAPNESTGLSEEECFPRIEGDETWLAHDWNSSELDALRTWTLENPPELLAESPYDTDPELQPDETAVCGVRVTGDAQYRLESYESPDDAHAAGAIVTHGMACGACSSLADLAAYAETPDQTGPVRQCSIDNFGQPVESLEACIADAVGFTAPCARIWAYNAINDRVGCGAICLEELDSPYNEPDGSLNPCLQCDEDMSGPVFKAVAGRTRRSSGLPAAICRPCAAVWRIEHDYDQ
jgi:hypothetical protein